MKDIKADKITVIGIGGVGGYLSALLCQTFSHVTLVARGGRRKTLETDGLRLNSDYKGRIHTHPERIADSLSDITEIQDYVFICVKNYSLDTIAQEVQKIADDHTVIMPVMNGVEAGDKLRSNLTRGIVVDSSIHIVAFAEPDYSIRHIGNYAYIRFGIMNPSTEHAAVLERLKELLCTADIDCDNRADILAAIWDKYMLNCAFNVLTAYYDTDVDGLRNSEKRKAEFRTLLEEAMAVAGALHITVAADFAEREFDRVILKLSGSASTSLKRDMHEGRAGELETFSGHLNRLADSLNVNIPLSRKLYTELRKRADS